MLESSCVVLAHKEEGEGITWGEPYDLEEDIVVEAEPEQANIWTTRQNAHIAHTERTRGTHEEQNHKQTSKHINK